MINLKTKTVNLGQGLW